MLVEALEPGGPGHGPREEVERDRRLADPFLDVERGMAGRVRVDLGLHAPLAEPAHVVPDLPDRAAGVVLAREDQQRDAHGIRVRQRVALLVERGDLGGEPPMRLRSIAWRIGLSSSYAAT